jgi:hypothetical protein
VVLTRENVRCGDMAAGTLLVYAHPAAEFALTTQQAASRVGQLDASGAELVAELLQRWPTLTAQARAALARQLLSRYGASAADLRGFDDGALRARLERLTRPQSVPT